MLKKLLEVALLSCGIVLFSVVLVAQPIPPPHPPKPLPSNLPPPNYDFADTQPVGELGFQHSVSMDGAAQISIPLLVPPGRRGVQPNLALTYSSRMGNGPLGVGWQLSGLSTITTCRKTWAVDGVLGGQYSDQLCLDGTRLVTIGGSEFRTEVDSYRKIIAHGPADYPDSFEVFSPDGTVYRYASRASSNGRIEGNVVSCTWGSTSAGVWQDRHGGCLPGVLQRRAWMLDEVEDKFKNRIEIDYDPSEPLLPTEIRYTYHPTSPNTKLITFQYEMRPDLRKFSMDGIDYTARQRLTSITVLGPGGLSYSSYADRPSQLRQYRLTYAMNVVTNQSTLTQVTECAGFYTGAPCKAPLSFAYTGTSIEFDDKTFSFAPGGFDYRNTFSWDGFRTADVNGDGFDDLLYRTLDVPATIATNMLDIDGTSVPPAHWNYRLSDGQAFGDETLANIRAVPDSEDLFTGFVDLDRNQTVDAVVPSLAGGVYNPYTAYTISQNGADGSFHPNPLPTDVYSLPQNGLIANDKIVAIADLNGDGKPDLAIRYGDYYNQYRWGVALNTSNQFVIQFQSPPMDFRTTQSTACIRPQPFSGEPYTNCPSANINASDPAFVVDIDGNGQNELIVPVQAREGEQVRGPKDVWWMGYNPELKALGFPLGLASTERRTGLSSMQMPRVFLDVNGDGLADAVNVDGQGHLYVAMNRGGSYDAPVQVPLFSPAVGGALLLPNEMRVGDFNNDGLEDIYLVSSGTLLQSDGNLGFIEKSLGLPIGDDNCASTDCPQFARRRWDQTLDFNGDGLIDFVQVRNGQTHVLQRKGPAPALLEAVTGGPLTPEVRFVYKATPEVQTPGTCAYPQNCLRKGMWLVAEAAVKANVASTAYPTGFNRTFYTYENGRFDLRGRGWLGFGRRVVVDEQTGATTMTEFDNTSTVADTQTPPATYRYPGAFRPTKEVSQVDERMAGETSGQVRRSTTQFQYTDTFEGQPFDCPCITSSTLSQMNSTLEEASAQGSTIGAFEPLTSHRAAYTYNTYGVVTNEVDETIGGPKIEIARVPTLQDLINWIVQRVDTVTETSTEPAQEAVIASTTEPARPAVAAQSVTRTTAFGWAPGTAAIKKVTIEPGNTTDPALYSVIDVTRDSTGNVRSVVTSANDGDATTHRTLQIDWDTLDQTLPWQIRNPLNQLETVYYQAGLGKPAVVDDVNGLRTVMKFDRFGRTRLIDVPSSADVTVDYGLSLDNLLSVTTTRASGETSKELVNAWSQTVRIEESRLDAKIAVVANTFTRLGQLATTTVPHYESQVTLSSPDAPTHLIVPPAYVSNSYDRSGRVRKRTVADGFIDPRHSGLPGETETWTYDGLVDHHVDSRAIEKTTERDGASRVIRTATLDTPATPKPGVGFPGHLHRHEVVSRYEYGPFNVLDAVTDSAGNRIENQYDILGRLVDSLDPSRGHSTAKYNGFGEAVYSSDGVGVKTTIHRDPLGRVKNQEHLLPMPPYSSTESYVWDTAVHGVGKLADAVSTDDIETIYSYDTLGRPSIQVWTIGGSQFALETDWDAFDRPQYIKYPAVKPGQLVLEYDYQPQGPLVQVKNQATQELYWHAVAQDASGVALTEQFGASITTNRSLDARKRLSSIQTTGPSGLLQQLSYDYSPGSLVSARHSVPDGIANADEAFDYDFLGRLIHWSVNQKGTASEQTYGYDDLGNLKSMTVDQGSGRTITNSYGPGTNSPNAGPYAVREMQENGSTSVFQYDNGGHQLSGGNRNVSWNEFDLPARIESTADNVTFQYDVAHRRVVKSGQNHSVMYVGSAYERHTGPNGTTHVFNLLGPRGVFGQVVWPDSAGGATSGTTSFFHVDGLGTPETISDATTGLVVEKVQYEPFGQRRNPSALATPAALSSTHSLGFTGHEPDDEFGLINMRGRIYDPFTARFLTADPVVQAPYFSQSLNRYAYVFNNPVNFVDPTGFQCEEADACIGGGGTDNDSGGWLTDAGNWLDDFFFGVNNNSGSVRLASSPPVSTPQQAPAKADTTRADAGPGWGGPGSSASTGSSGGSGLFSGLGVAWQEYYAYTNDIERQQAKYDRDYNLLYQQLLPEEEKLLPQDALSGAGTSPIASNFANQRVVAQIGSRPENILWSLVRAYAPGAASSIVGGIGELGARAELSASGEGQLAGTIRSVNPTRGFPNCVNCSIAADYTLAGNPTVADIEGPYSTEALAAWMGGRFVSVTGPIQIGSMLIESGNGAQGIVYGESLIAGESGHVWNVVNQGGTIRFLDSQVIRAGVNNAGVGVDNFGMFKDFRFLLTRPGTPP
jgi:RHS repeat-associated protein